MSTTNENGTSGQPPFDEELCERYLFGELSEAEQERFETAYFSDDSFFNKFLAVKDEVLDLYSRNELDHDKRRRMEPHFLATRSRKKRLTDSRDFIDSITRIADRATRAAAAPAVAADPEPGGFLDALRSIFAPPRFAVAVGLIVVLAFGLWVLVKRDAVENIADSLPPPAGSTNPTSSSEMSPESMAADGNAQGPLQHIDDPGRQSKPTGEREMAINANPAGSANNGVPIPGSSPAPPSNQMARSDPPETKPPDNANMAVQVPTPGIPKQPDPKPEIAGVRTETVTLESASRSATRQNTAQIGSATQNVQIRMVFGGEAYSSYSVRVSGVGGRTIWRESNLKTGMNEGTKSLTVNVPAGSFTRKDYIVVLEGRSKDGTTETIREYYLRVDRQ